MKHRVIATVIGIFMTLLVSKASAVFHTDFCRTVDENSNEDIQKLINYRNSLVKEFTWEEMELEIAPLQKQAQEINQRIAKLKDSLNNATIKISDEEAQVKALVSKAGGVDKLSSDDKAIYDTTIADIRKVKEASKKIEQRIADINKELSPIQKKIDEWTQKPPSTKKLNSEEHKWIHNDTVRLLRQIAGIVGKYEKKKDTAIASDAISMPIENLWMNPDGTFKDQKSADALFDPEGAKVIYNRLFKDLRDNGYSEDDREIAKKMLVKTLAYESGRYAETIKDEKERARIEQEAKQLSEDIFKRKRSTIHDITTMYDLFIASIEGWMKQ